MTQIAIIGGTGCTGIPELDHPTSIEIETKFGTASIDQYDIQGKSIIFLPRHGKHFRLPPHKINFRANILALKESGVDKIIAINTVGGISSEMVPGTLVLPDQIIDYTYGRANTFFDGPADDCASESMHIDFTQPFTPELHNLVAQQLENGNHTAQLQGVYGCVQGPRLETAAEIRKLKKDGCDIVGMTAMPEAALAREIDLEYVSICVVVNWAAGINSGNIKVNEMNQILSSVSKNLWTIIFKTVNLL